MKLSIVIPTIGRLSALRRCLKPLGRQTPPGFDFEVIVVSNPGQEAVRQLVEEARQMGVPASYYAVAERGANRARNRGAQQARGTHLLFLDDDTEVIDREFLRALGDVIQECGDGSAWGGYYLSPASANAATRAYNGAANLWLLRSRRTHRRHPVMVGGCTLIERDVFLQVGGFDEACKGAAEELALSQRVQSRGHRVILSRKLSVYHHFQGGWPRALANAYSHGQVKPRTQDPRIDSISLRHKLSLVRRSLALDRCQGKERDARFLIPSLATYYLVVLVGSVVGRWKMRSAAGTAPVLDGVSSISGHSTLR